MCPGRKMRVEEEEQYRKVFRHLDSNGDGKMTAAELWRSALAGEILITEEEAVRAAAGGDGMKLEMDEFLRMRMMMEEEEEEVEEAQKEKDLREAFKMYEDEKLGNIITARSLKRMLSRLGEKTSVGDCEAMISTFDLDGDGVLSFHEFKIMMS